MAQACNPSTQEAEAEGLPVQSHPGLHSKTLAKKKIFLKGGEGEELYKTGRKYGQKGNSEIRTKNFNALRLHKDIPGTDINSVLTGSLTDWLLRVTATLYPPFVYII